MLATHTIQCPAPPLPLTPRGGACAGTPSRTGTASLPPQRSLTDRYGPITQPQYQLLARVDAGEDVRFWSQGVHPSTAWRLIERRILDCDATTCRFRLLPPKGVTPRGVRKAYPNDVR